MPDNGKTIEFVKAAFAVYQKIDELQAGIDKAVKNLKDASKSTSDYKRETLKEIAKLRGQIASGAIQGELIK
jgi:uncharacterized protein YlxW (UPF0749 family)